jgi:hypothetical protein
VPLDNNTVVRWRAAGDYRPNNASKAGILAETRTFFRSESCALLTALAATDGDLRRRTEELRERYAPPEPQTSEVRVQLSDVIRRQRIRNSGEPDALLEELQARIAAELDCSEL